MESAKNMISENKLRLFYHLKFHVRFSGKFWCSKNYDFDILKKKILDEKFILEHDETRRMELLEH